jgi:hypothetical protein
MYPNSFRANFALSPEALVADGRYLAEYRLFHKGVQVHLGYDGAYATITTGGSGTFKLRLPAHVEASMFTSYSMEASPKIGWRPPGLYRYLSAEATVTHDAKGDHKIHIVGTKLEDMDALYGAILRGAIAPSFDGSADYVGQPIRRTIREIADLLVERLTLRWKNFWSQIGFSR